MSIDDSVGTIPLDRFIGFASSFRNTSNRIMLNFTSYNSKSTCISKEYQNHGSAQIYILPPSENKMDFSFMDLRTCPRASAFEKIEDILLRGKEYGLEFIPDNSIEVDGRVSTWYIAEKK